eukprot:781322-Karenia_brevis.AAC.1
MQSESRSKCKEIYERTEINEANIENASARIDDFDKSIFDIKEILIYDGHITTDATKQKQEMQRMHE